jgi:hypothetical protein
MGPGWWFCLTLLWLDHFDGETISKSKGNPGGDLFAAAAGHCAALANPSCWVGTKGFWDDFRADLYGAVFFHHPWFFLFRGGN